ncbi:hemerythrin domain-containing protein [Neobacillus novalis]|uniref:Hemerythrin domain-containing protein n=1 Tax=Neobacillus novalis TaxID=220687 RepID=A0AA95MHM4_9BACI|nr:hemerythrin domain-containing protein [Neobacillus novalis]WHY83869.1 hemerythrin domain-containing protein [Neobacillus novalis]
MSGPSLRKPDAHSSIHEAALNEALELRNLFQKCLDDGEIEKALQVIEVTIEHWETRTLKHAEAEEEGLYKDIVKENPGLKSTVIQLTRDHDLMRRIVENMKVMLQTQEPDKRMISMLDSLVLIDEIHNEDEMNNLLGMEKNNLGKIS